MTPILPSRGSVLLDRFEIKEVVGRGGMNVVYRAFDRARGKEVALKQLHAALLRDPSARERFLNEIHLSCELTHPSIVRVFDVPLDGKDVFVLMELLQGETLRSVMERRKQEGEVKGLAEKLRQRSQAAQQQIKDLEQRKHSMEQSLRSARDRKDELQREVDAVEQEQQLAEAGWTLCQRVVFESSTLTELKGLLTLGSRQVQDKLYTQAETTLRKAKQGYKQLLALDRVGKDVMLARD